MSRNENSHFALNPNVEISRSRFDRSSSVKFTGNAGYLIPFYVDEVLPGDTFDVSTHKLCRMQTLITPVMDDMYLDTYYFFVPNRLVWEHWQEFMGENSTGPWAPTVEYSVPQVQNPQDTSAGYSGWPTGSIADYMGVPTNVKGPFTVSALPFRAYALIWNEWFRDENLQNPQQVDVNDATLTVNLSDDNGVKQAECGLTPLKVSKYRDYFTTCLPAPQKGPDVLLPLGLTAPVYSFTGKTVPENYDASLGTRGTLESLALGENYSTEGYRNMYIQHNSGTSDNPYDTVIFDERPTSDQVSGLTGGVTPSNLWTDLTNATSATINQLRLAFQIQKIYEKDARGGTRYIEILKTHFGVTSPDSRLQRPEYLGGNRMTINVNQVVQSSGTTSESPQGNTAAYSLTVDSNDDMVHSFVEHGLLIGVCCVRYKHTYQQGLERFWSRKNRFDYYFPVLANIGEQPVYNKEIYLQGNSIFDNEVFGYNEAWADYRYKPNRVSGEMRSNIDHTLDFWHLADNYEALPKLGSEWIQEDPVNIDRVLAVQSSVSNQFLFDFYIRNYCTRPMPTYSIPGLIDHH